MHVIDQIFLKIKENLLKIHIYSVVKSSICINSLQHSPPENMIPSKRRVSKESIEMSMLAQKKHQNTADPLAQAQWGILFSAIRCFCVHAALWPFQVGPAACPLAQSVQSRRQNYKQLRPPLLAAFTSLSPARDTRTSWLHPQYQMVCRDHGTPPDIAVTASSNGGQH